MERVDVTGEVCPRPALIVRRRLSELDPGEELLVHGDYPPAEENLRRTCTKHGFEVAETGGSADTDADTDTGDTGDMDETGGTVGTVGGDADGNDFELKIEVTEDAALR